MPGFSSPRETWFISFIPLHQQAALWTPTASFQPPPRLPQLGRLLLTNITSHKKQKSWGQICHYTLPVILNLTTSYHSLQRAKPMDRPNWRSGPTKKGENSRHGTIDIKCRTSRARLLRFNISYFCFYQQTPSTNRQSAQHRARHLSPLPVEDRTTTRDRPIEIVDSHCSSTSIGFLTANCWPLSVGSLYGSTSPWSASSSSSSSTFS